METLEKRKEEKKKLDGRKKFLGPLVPRDEKVHHTTDLEQNEYENMQKKHLKAYLKGETKFKYKGQWYDVETNVKRENDNKG
jgi:hypothetical protein